MTKGTLDFEKTIGRIVIAGVKGAAAGTLGAAFSAAVGYALSQPWPLIAGCSFAAFFAPVLAGSMEAAINPRSSNDGPQSPSSPDLSK
ncbi:MAG: hypothetical protein WC807_16615 [Hyphomicrobium sp.]